MLPAADRIPFVVRDAVGSPIGNIGLCKVTTSSAGLDNVLRGETFAVRGFMAFATSALLRWVREQVGIPKIYLHVLSNNARAIKLYEAVGFSCGRVQTPYREESAGEVRFTPTGLSARPGAVGLLEMTLKAGG